MSKRSTPTDTAQSAENGGFLHRWSRQKSQASQHASSDSLEVSGDPSIDVSPGLPEGVNELAEAELGGNTADDSLAEGTEELLLSDADMPPIESLDSSSDVSMFLNKGVSETMRKAAFRRLFSLPAYNIRDGLNDYDEDYTYFEPLGDTITSDMKFHALRKERERLAREAELAEAERLEAELAEAERLEAARELDDTKDDQVAEEEQSDEIACESSNDEQHDRPVAAADEAVSEQQAEHLGADQTHATTHQKAAEELGTAETPPRQG